MSTLMISTQIQMRAMSNVAQGSFFVSVFFYFVSPQPTQVTHNKIIKAS